MAKEGKLENIVSDAICETQSASSSSYSIERIDDTHWRCVCGQVNHVMDEFCTACSEPRPDEFTPKISGSEKSSQIEQDSNGEHDAQHHATENPQILSQKLKSSASDEPEISDTTTNIESENDARVSIPTSQPQNSSQRLSFLKNKSIVSVVVLCVFCFGIYFIMNNKSERKNTAHIPSINRTENTQINTKNDVPVKKEKEIKKEEHRARTELSLGGLDLGVDVEDMHRILGKENSSKMQGKHRFYYFNGLDVGCMGSVVHALVSDSPVVATKQGIRVGSSLNEVLSTYGNRYSKFSYDRLDMYEYTYSALNGESGILRFAINNKSLVDYISVRIPDSPQVDVEEAKKVFREYHLAITNHDLRKAYDMLTFERQNQMGMYENYIRGYSDTLSSEVVEIDVRTVNDSNVVLDYRLKARDRYKGNKTKELFFSGSVNMVYKDGRWMIGVSESKKISERII